MLVLTARYHQSCDSYFQSGWRRSGVYVIDVDGSGPVEPTYVSCQMGISTEGDYYGQTVVEHNLHNLTKVRGTTLPDIRLRLTYRLVGGKTGGGSRCCCKIDEGKVRRMRLWVDFN